MTCLVCCNGDSFHSLYCCFVRLPQLRKGVCTNCAVLGRQCSAVKSKLCWLLGFWLNLNEFDSIVAMHVYISQLIHWFLHKSVSQGRCMRWVLQQQLEHWNRITDAIRHWVNQLSMITGNINAQVAMAAAGCRKWTLPPHVPIFTEANAVPAMKTNCFSSSTQNKFTEAPAELTAQD